MGTPEFDIANAMVEGIENNFKGKSDAEIKELVANSINTLMMSFMMAGDNGVQMLILTLSCCTKITCGAVFKDAGMDYYEKDIYYWSFSNDIN